MSTGKCPSGKPKRRWEDSVKIDVERLGLDGAQIPPPVSASNFRVR